MPGENYRHPSVGFDALRTGIERAMQGRGSLVFLTGEPGIGKTTAAQDTATQAAAAGATVLWSACAPDDAVPHSLWRSLLADLGGAGAGALAALSGAEPPDPAAATAARAAAYARVVDAVAAQARMQPMVIVMDDLHWADEGSLRLLAALRSRLAATPMLVVGTYRDNEVAEDSPLASMAAAADRIAMNPLTRDEVAALVAAVVGRDVDAAVVDDVLRRAGGNPFLVVQVSRLLATGRHEELPVGARDVLRRRLEALPPEVRAVLDAAAIVPSPFRPSAVASVGGVATDEALLALDAAATARIVQSAAIPGEWEFVHDLFRQAALDALPATTKAELHASAARALIEAGGAPASIAHHLLSAAAGPDVDAARWSMRAAESSLAQFAWHDAAAHADRALAVLPSSQAGDELRAEAWLVSGRARLLAGDRDRAVAAFTTAAALGRSTGSPELLGRAALAFAADLGGFEVRLFDQRQIDLLEEAAAALAASGEAALRALVLARLSVALSFAAPTERRLALAEQAVALARSGSDPVALAGALAAHCDAISGPAHVERRLAESTEIIELADATGDRGLELLGRRLRVVALLESGDVVATREEISAFSRRAAEAGNPRYSWYVPLWRGMWALAAGDIAGAEEATVEVERIGERAASENATMLAIVLRAEIHHQTDRVDALAGLLDDVRRVMGELYDAPQAYGNMTRYFTDMGRRVEARHLLDRMAAAGLGAMPDDAEWLPGVAMLIDAAVMHSHPVLEQAVDVAMRFADRFAFEGIAAVLHGSMARYVALGLCALGRHDEAVPYARQALEANLGIGTLLVATSQRTLADALRDGDEARELHAAADAAYVALGLWHKVRGAIPSAATAGDAALVREGDVWHVTFAGATTIVKHVKGMVDLATLLANAGRDIHVTELERLPADVAAAARATARDETLDRQAVAAYRARLQELDDEIIDAEDANDIVRVERARAERDFLLEELSSSLGIGGRARAAGPDPVERLRKAVTARVRDAIRRIDAVHPALARHLTNSVRTGTFCSYRPEQPLAWRCEVKSGAQAP